MSLPRRNDDRPVPSMRSPHSNASPYRDRREGLASKPSTASAASASSAAEASSANGSTAISSVESIEPMRPRTIADLLAPQAVPFDELDERFHHILMLVRALIGVMPNCFGILEMFPPMFTTYNLLIPNCMNVPFLLWGVAAPVDLVALAVYFSARSSQCPYCSVHTCSFALRRGLDEEVLNGSRSFTKKEAAIIDVAVNMSSFPNHLVEEDRRRIYSYLSPANVEWIVLSISTLGYLTTFMSALGTDMEQTAVERTEELLKSTGWSQGKHAVTSPGNYLQEGEKKPPRGDTLINNLMMLRHMPTALSYDMAATKKVPKAWPEIGEYLMRKVGHSFPVLGLLTHTRAVRAITEAICLNLDGITCNIEPDLKYLIGIVFAGVNRNRLMAKEFRKMTLLMVDYFEEETINRIYEFSKEDTDFSVDYMTALTDSALLDTGLTEMQVRMLYISKACSFMPTQTTPAVVEACVALRGEHTVELIGWVSMLSFLQKLYIFYYPSCSERSLLRDAQLGERAPVFTKL